jgi:exodeoxyribonuclease VIII
MNYSPGIYENLPYEEYAAIPAYRSHDLTSVIKCPYTWKYQKDLEPSPALLEGRVQHTVFLEHHKFAEEFVIQPNIDRRTKAGKAEYEDFSASIGNRTAITQDLYDTCIKCRMDWYDNQYIWDLKTCRDASPRGFKQAVNNFKYHMQASIYVDACKSLDLRADGFKFLAQEKAHPYPYAVYELSKEALAYARSKNEQALATILACEQEQDFKPYGLEGTQKIELGDLY